MKGYFVLLNSVSKRAVLNLYLARNQFSNEHILKRTTQGTFLRKISPVGVL
jgi:hypothetical protein